MDSSGAGRASLRRVRAGPKALALAAAAAACLAPIACGSDDDGGGETAATSSGPSGAAEVTSGGPEGESGTQVDEGASAAEASPEAAAEGPDSGELSADDEQAVTRTVRLYVSALDRHDARRVCALLEPGSLRSSELPVTGDGCADSLAASIGHRRPGGTPAWRRTSVLAVDTASIEEGGARVTATVRHRFADRNYVSIEEDVIYLERDGDRWLVAKPSATLYRAIGYPEPPLRAFEPPR
jgi:hypothetical protein